MPNNDTVERLAGGIAHDFDVLLKAIVAHAESLSDHLSPGDPRAVKVAAIRQAAERASGLTRQLLAFSRTLALRPTVVNVNDVVERSRHTLGRIVGGDIVLETRPADGLWPIRADVEQIEQILHNLVLSARDAMPNGGALTIATANARVKAADARVREMEPGDYVELSVTDTGIEIDTSVQAHLFEPFLASNARARGTGLGLAMVYGAVKQNGGYIIVESPFGDDGRGTRFTVYVPATVEVADAERTVDGVDADHQSQTVLLLGDDRNVDAFIGDVLRRRGYRLLMATDAWHALRVAEEHGAPIDLLITTGKHGALVADALRERRSSTRVLYVSASASDAPPARTAGRDGNLSLPFTPEALARKVRTILES
jgi:two-component system cell cycle sensor histidine kinase/response regulator CckA